VAIGSSICQVAVVLPSSVTSSTRTPVAAAVVPAGTVMRNMKVALSVGWLFPGNHDMAADGWLTVKKTPSTHFHPIVMNGTPGSSICSGVPE